MAANVVFYRLGPMKPKKCSKKTPTEDLEVVKMAKEIKNTWIHT